MIYVDTSVLVALLVRESSSNDVDRWYRQTRATLVSSTWCATEVASALGMKQRTGEIDSVQAQEIWRRFGVFMTGELVLIEPSTAQFHRAALLALDGENGVRAGDALHLAAAEEGAAKTFATLDRAQNRMAQRLKFKSVSFLG